MASIAGRVERNGLRRHEQTKSLSRQGQVRSTFLFPVVVKITINIWSVKCDHLYENTIVKPHCRKRWRLWLFLSVSGTWKSTVSAEVREKCKLAADEQEENVDSVVRYLNVFLYKKILRESDNYTEIWKQ